MADNNAAQVNAQLQREPRYQQARAVYQQTMLRLGRAPTILQEREDPTVGDAYRAAVTDARRVFGQTVHGIVQGYHLPGQPQAWFLQPDTGQLYYQEDHSLRNIALMMGGILVGGAVANAIGAGGSAAAAGSSAAGFSTGAGATGAAETAGLLGGYGSVAGAGAGTAAGLGTAGAAGAWDAAGNFIGPSTYGTTAGGTGTAGSIWNAVQQGNRTYQQGRSVWDSIYGAGQDAGALALGRADARQQEALASQRQDQIALDRYRAGLEGTTADLAQRRFSLEAPGARAGNAVRGDVLANAQDVSFSGLSPRLQGMMPTIQGGLRPSIFSPSTRALGGLMSQEALEGQQRGDTFAPLPTLPTQTPLPSGNALDTGLTLGGTFATLAPTFADLLDRYRNRRKPQPDFATAPSDSWEAGGGG